MKIDHKLSGQASIYAWSVFESLLRQLHNLPPESHRKYPELRVFMFAASMSHDRKGRGFPVPRLHTGIRPSRKRKVDMLDNVKRCEIEPLEITKDDPQCQAAAIEVFDVSRDPDLG